VIVGRSRLTAAGLLALLGPTAAGLLALLGLAGCAANYRLDDTVSATREPPREVLRLRWSKQLVQREFMDYRPQEWASAAIDDSGVIYVGSSARRFYAFEGKSGQVRWRFEARGAIASAPLIDTSSSTVYVGSDDGTLYALDLRDGRKKWGYATQGTINRSPALAGGTLLFTTSEGRIYALDAKTGAWRWQYDREIPEGFTIQGYAGVAVRGSVAYTGFADGTLVALRVLSGDIIWTKSLAGGKTQFMDVDTTPVVMDDLLLAASYAGGIYAVACDSGSVRWQYPADGATHLTQHGGSIYFTAPRLGLVSLDTAGHLRWRQGVARGVPTAAVPAGTYLFLGGTESGLYATSHTSGQLLQYFDPGHGISASPTVGAGLLVVLTNEGWLYTFQIVSPRGSSRALG
jgi:outer membrane protein assembly factor BamB